MAFTLSMDTDGPSFHQCGGLIGPGVEVARILRALADRVEYEQTTYSPAANGGPLVDAIGITVGTWELTDDGTEEGDD